MYIHLHICVSWDVYAHIYIYMYIYIYTFYLLVKYVCIQIYMGCEWKYTCDITIFICIEREIGRGAKEIDRMGNMRACK